MSELKTNKISPATLTDVTLGDSGDTFTIPTGATIVNNGTATGFADPVDNITIGQLNDRLPGQMITWSTAGTPTPVATGSAGQVLTSAGAGQQPSFQGIATGAQMYSGYFSRGQNTASGNVTYSGIGFTPKGVIFHVYVGNGTYDQASFGFDDGTRHNAVSTLDYNSANAWYGDGTNSIWPPESSTNRQFGAISSFTNDGFVFSWTKGGNPSGGSLIVYYMAIG
jgi:hypothetical protein